MNTDTIIIEAFLVWDHSRAEHAEAPELLSMQSTEDAAIAYGKATFESDTYTDCIIERWISGKDMPEEQFTLASKLDN